MKKKTYIKPDIEVVSIEGEALICSSSPDTRSWNTNDAKEVKDVECESKGRSSGDDEGGYGFDYDW